MVSEARLRITKPLRTERLILRPLTAGDLDDVFEYAGDDEAIRYLPWPSRTREQVADHLAKRLNTTLTNDGDAMVLGVELPAEGADSRARIIGDLTLVLTNVEHRQATVGWVMNRAFHGRGYATEAATRLMTLAFDELGVHRVHAHLDPRNERSAALCRRLGMRHEAHFVHNEIFKGEWGDEAVYAILDVEWTARNAIDG